MSFDPSDMYSDDYDDEMFDRGQMLAAHPNNRPEPTKKAWVNKDGKRILFKRMTHAHLCNTIRFLARRFTVIQHANFRYDQAVARAGPAKFFPTYAGLVKEARRRRLTP